VNWQQEKINIGANLPMASRLGEKGGVAPPLFIWKHLGRLLLDRQQLKEVSYESIEIITASQQQTSTQSRGLGIPPQRQMQQRVFRQRKRIGRFRTMQKLFRENIPELTTGQGRSTFCSLFGTAIVRSVHL
jgi:hypothetical protein